MNRLLSRNASHVISFFAARRKEEGGFSQTPRLPATVEDTYYALRSLSALREAGLSPPAHLFQGHAGFLQRRLGEAVAEVRVAYQLGWVARLLGHEALLEPLVRAHRSLPPRLEALFYGRRLLALAGRGEEVAEEPSREEVRTVRDLRQFLYLRGATPSSPLKEEWRGWLLACQNGDGGFGFMPGTTSYMENCYYAVRAMAQVGMRPMDCQGLRGFVEAARSGRGGFGRKHMGVPFPSSTWHGVAVLRFLEQER